MLSEAMKIEIKYDVAKDIKNWQQCMKTTSYGYSWVKNLPSDITVHQVNSRSYLMKYLEEKYFKNKNIERFIEQLDKRIKDIPIKEDLEQITGHKITWPRVTIYITTFPRCPYNFETKHFYLICLPDDQIDREVTGIYHELQHFIFHENYNQQINNNSMLKNGFKVHDLKEALTALNNEILEKRHLPLDSGYEMHEKLRREIIKLKFSGKTYDEIIKTYLGI